MATDESKAAMPSSTVYVQDSDAYPGRLVADAIRARNAFWDGGADVPAPSDDDPDDCTRRLVLVDVADDADMILVNLFGDLDQAAALIKAMRGAVLTRPRFLIGLSTALTWAGAPGDTDENQFRGRSPAPAASRQKLLETLIVNSARDRLRTAVVAAGVLYGAGESDLHALFRQAWMGGPDTVLSVIGSGTNIIPTVHVADFAAAVVRFVERPPRTRPYVVVTDKARDAQLAIVTAIARALSTGAVTSMPELDAVGVRDGVAPHVLTADVRFARETAWVSGLEMEWCAENGLVASIETVVNEFVSIRDLRPIRVAVIGAPGSGRSFWARKIAALFYLPLVCIRDLIANAKQQSGVDLQLDKAGRAPITVIAALVRAELQRNELRNKGYVLDGYPRSAEEAKALFDPSPVEPDPAAAPVDTDPEASSSAPLARQVPIAPDRIVCVSTADALTLSRAKENGAQAVVGHNDEKGIQRRLQAWNKAMTASPEAHPRTFFAASVEILDVNGAEAVAAVDDVLSAYIAGPRPPSNYHPTDDEIAAARFAQQERDRIAHESELEHQRQLELEREQEVARHQRKAAEHEAQLKELARKEAELVADRARPLQEYLDQHVVPVVVQGLYEIAQVRPDDPIDYLAEFLFRASTSGAATITATTTSH